MKLSFREVKANRKIKVFIKRTERYLDVLGYTDHGLRHVSIVSERAADVAKKIGLSKRDQELAAICGFCHDMGNFMGRTYHHYWSAFLFSQVYLNKATNPDEVAEIMQAIVAHDKNEFKIDSRVAACLILADKSDVDRSRVKDKTVSNIAKDIHDRVNYSVTHTHLTVDKVKKEIILKMKLDTHVTDAMEYFEIFTERMTFCRQAAQFLGYEFVLIINDNRLS
ncbi:MAG: HD domain-containing protein [bacterium]